MLDEQELVGAWDQGLTCLALRALAAAVAHSDDAGRPVVLLALCVGKGLRRVRLLLPGALGPNGPRRGANSLPQNGGMYHQTS